MSTQDEGFIGSLLADTASAQLVLRYKALADLRGPVWHVLPGLLGAEIERFERMHIAAAYAAVLGADPKVVDRRQDFLARTAVTSILFPLEAFEDRLLVHVEQRGLSTLYHHVVKEFAAEGTDAIEMVAVAGACRSAVFAIEDRMRKVGSSPEGPEQILALHRQLVELLHTKVDINAIPYGWAGLALLWVTALVGLGNLPSETSTTEHYADV